MKAFAALLALAVLVPGAVAQEKEPSAKVTLVFGGV